MSKRLAAAPVGKTLTMRCLRLEKDLVNGLLHCVAMLYPGNWPCCRKSAAAHHNRVVPLTKFQMDQAAEKLAERDDGLGAFKNENRRLLLGFKRSMRLRDGASHPELKLNMPAQVFRMSWCADFEFRVTQARTS